MNDLLSQPWQIQLCLACGYAAYWIAYVGNRQHHHAMDVTFSTLLFGLVPLFVLATIPAANSIVAALSAIAASCVFAGIWRKWLRRFVHYVLRQSNISWSDDDPSALATISENAHHRVSQFGVLLDDGTWLYCKNPAQFEDAPFRPIIIGPSGDVALYLTHIERSGEPEKPLTSVRNAYYGDRITYIPAARICRITIRHAPTSRPSLAAAEAEEPRS